MTSISPEESTRAGYTPPPPPAPPPGPGKPSRVSRGSTAFSADLLEAVRHDSAELQRDVLLWQRWVRYAAAFLAVAGVLVLAMDGLARPGIVPIAITAGAYLSFTAFTGWFLKYGTGRGLPPRLPAVMLLADNLLLASLVYFSSPPVHFYRILIFGFLALQLTVLYFGAGSGAWTAGLTLASYLILSLVADPYVSGLSPSLPSIAFDGLLFSFIAAAQVITVGHVRTRLRTLREYCKRVEMGDLTGTDAVGVDSRPDDLTLLARSFGDMRSRLIELIGSDPLTGCLNRRALEERLSREWRQSKRRNSQLAVLAIDVDKFKLINDSLGHPTGDVVLQEIAAIMRSTARDTDAVARIGGDEFVVLLPDTGWQGAMTFAERLRRNVDDHHFGTDPSPDVTISIGVALARGSDDLSVGDLLEEADRSLYKAKSAGRNRISA